MNPMNALNPFGQPVMMDMRPPTCINRGMYTGYVCGRNVHPPIPVRPVENANRNKFEYCLRKLEENQREERTYGVSDLLPFGLGSKKRRSKRAPNQKWLCCEFDGDEEVTTSEVPLNVNLGPGDYTDKNLQLTLNLKLIPKAPPRAERCTISRYFREKRNRFRDMLSCFPNRWFGRHRDDTSGLGMRDLMARMVSALDDIRAALRDMKRGQDEFVGNVCPSPSLGPSVRESHSKDDSEGKRNVEKKGSVASQESMKSSVENEQSEHSQHRMNKKAASPKDSEETITDSKSSHRRKDTGSTNTESSSSRHSPSESSIHNHGDKSETTLTSKDKSYTNDQSVNFVLANVRKHKKRHDPLYRSSIVAKIETLAEATSKLQELVSAPVTRKLITNVGTSLGDILQAPEIYIHKNEAACNTEAETSPNSEDKSTQIRRQSKAFRKRNSKPTEKQDAETECLPKPMIDAGTFTSIVNLSLFPGLKENSQQQLRNNILRTRSRNKRRKSNKLNTNALLPVASNRNSAKSQRVKSPMNKFIGRSSTDDTTSADQHQGARRKMKTSPLNRKTRPRPVRSLVTTTLSSSDKLSSTDEGLPGGSGKKCVRQSRSAREQRRQEAEPTAVASRCEDNEHRWLPQSRFAVTDKYSSLTAVGPSSVSPVVDTRRSTLPPGPIDPADELLRAMLERTQK